MNSVLTTLGPSYTVLAETHPKDAMQAAEKQTGLHWRELVKGGWAGPLHRLIHDPTIRDMWVSHGQLFARSRTQGKTHTGLYLTPAWTRYLVRLWQNAYHTADKPLPPKEDAIFRSTFLFTDGGGIRYVYQPSLVSAYGPSLYIRRLPGNPITLDDLVRNNTLSQPVADTLIAFLQVGTPLIISGQTGSGKTTLLGALVHKLQQMHYPLHLLVIERSHELPLAKPALRWQEDDEGGLGLDHLAEKATQLGLEWLIIGECTGGEAFFATKAFGQGVPMATTLHACF